MSNLKNTLAHILEHKHHLDNANEATTQQYVVLPILQALGWDSTNLATMDVLPEYQIESKRADYALHVKRDESPIVLVECKRWDEPITRHAEQICFYAYSGNIPLAIITNGRHWRFYLSHWQAASLSDRVFCETDVEDRDRAVSNLETYLLKSNVASGEAALNAEIALKEKETADVPKIESHREVSKATKTKSREKKPSISERYSSETTEEARNEIARQVVELRINSSGSKPLSWRRIREKLGLKNDQFHKVIRLSAGYRTAVIDRIKSLKAQEGGWEYSGKLEVLTGIEITEEELS